MKAATAKTTRHHDHNSQRDEHEQHDGQHEAAGGELVGQVEDRAVAVGVVIVAIMAALRDCQPAQIVGPSPNAIARAIRS